MTITFIGTSGCTAATISGGVATATFATAPSAGDTIIALSVIGSTKSTGGTVTSSSGIIYSLLATVNTSRVWGRIYARRSTGEGGTTIDCSGTGGSSDSAAVLAFVFRGTDPGNVLSSNVITQTNGTGASSLPDSPAGTSFFTGDAIVSAVCNSVYNASLVTAPSCDGTIAKTFLNLISTGATDTLSCQGAMSWFLSTGSSKAYNPNSYSSFTTGSWVGFTVVVKSTDTQRGYDATPAQNYTVLYPSVSMIGY